MRDHLYRFIPTYLLSDLYIRGRVLFDQLVATKGLHSKIHLVEKLKISVEQAKASDCNFRHPPCASDSLKASFQPCCMKPKHQYGIKCQLKELLA
jgi:hypothetical protein